MINLRPLLVYQVVVFQGVVCGVWVGGWGGGGFNDHVGKYGAGETMEVGE